MKSGNIQSPRLLPAGSNKTMLYSSLVDVDNMIDAPNPFAASPLNGLSSLARYFDILKRNGWYVAAFALLSTVIVLFACSAMPPVYESTATIDVDVQAAPGIIGQEAQRPLSVTDSDQILSTQVNLLQSDAVLRPVTEELQILPKEMGYSQRAVQSGAFSADAPVQLKKLTVKRVPSTYLIKVSYRSNDPRRAAAVANAVAKSYISHTYDVRLQSSVSLSTYMDKQLQEMKGKMERSSAALASYEKELDVINPEQKTSIISARLLQLNEAYTDAQSDRVSKETAYNSAKLGTLEAVETSPQAELLRKLVEKKDELQADFAATSQTYGKKHPAYKTVSAQIAQIDSQIEAARKNIIERARIEFQQSLAKELELKKTVDENKREFDRINSKSFAYQQLRRDAENDRRLYEDVVRRIREAGLNSAFQNSSLRLADAARPSVKPVFPDFPLLGAAAFIASLMIGYVSAVVFHLLSRTVHGANEIVNGLGLKVVATLPKVKQWKSANVTTLASGKKTGAAIVNVYRSLFTTSIEAHSPQVASFNESIRALRNTILSFGAKDNPASVLITSAVAGEGKSTVALALAMSHALKAKRTLLIDADIRRPSLVNSEEYEFGLADVLSDGLPWREVVQKTPDYPALDIIPAGKNSYRACDHLDHLGLIIEQAREAYDLIVIDSSPVLGFADPTQIASMVNGVVLISKASSANLSQLELALDQLHTSSANVLGLVLNEVADLHLKTGYPKYVRAYMRAMAAS